MIFFNLISSGFQQVELYRLCYLVGVKGRGEEVFKAMLHLQHSCG